MTPKKELRLHHCVVVYKILNELEREAIDRLNFILDEKHKLTVKYWKLTKNDLGLAVQQAELLKKEELPIEA